jgi:hypothetical protein
MTPFYFQSVVENLRQQLPGKTNFADLDSKTGQPAHDIRNMLGFDMVVFIAPVSIIRFLLQIYLPTSTFLIKEKKSGAQPVK